MRPKAVVASARRRRQRREQQERGLDRSACDARTAIDFAGESSRELKRLTRQRRYHTLGWFTRCYLDVQFVNEFPNWR